MPTLPFDQLVITVSVSQLAILAVALVLTAIACGLVLKRIGYSPLWGLLCFLPGIAILGLWILAFAPWPSRGQPA